MTVPPPPTPDTSTVRGHRLGENIDDRFSYVRGQSGGPSQAEKLIARLESRLTGPHPNYELAPRRGGNTRRST